MHDIPFLLALRSGGVVASRRGARGGYYLAKPPSAITLAEIVRLTEDGLVTAPASRRSAGGVGFGLTENPFTPIWSEIEACIGGTLEGISIADMCKRVRSARQTTVQDYTI